MNRAGRGVVLLSLLLSTAGERLRAEASLIAEPFRVADNASAPRVAFASTGPGPRFISPDAYIRLRYPAYGSSNPLHNRRRPPRTLQLRCYTQNPSWPGQSGQRNGLVNAPALTDRIPLYRRSFDALQPAAPAFDAGNFPLWSLVKDPLDADFQSLPQASALPLEGDGESYVYLGADDPVPGPAAAYDTQIVFELFNGFGASAPPQVAHAPFSVINDLFRRALLLCDVTANLDLISAVLNYRVTGQGAAWKQVPFFIDDDPENPFLYHLSAEVPAADVAAGGALEYWVEVDDGIALGSVASQSSPVQAVLEPRLEQDVSIRGGTLVYRDGVPTDGEASIFLPPGAVLRTTRFIMTRRPASILPRSLTGPPPGGSFPWPVFEVSSLGFPALLRPGLLTMVYEDMDSDGVVDGTSVRASSLRIYRFDGFDWRPLGARLDSSRRQVQTTFFAHGMYALVPESSQKPFKLKPAESVFSPGVQDGVNDVLFFDSAVGVRSLIRIFDVAGRVIREIRDQGVWDGRDEQGRLVESGVYVYQAECDGQKASGSITVAK